MGSAQDWIMHGVHYYDTTELETWNQPYDTVVLSTHYTRPASLVLRHGDDEEMHIPLKELMEWLDKDRELIKGIIADDDYVIENKTEDDYEWPKREIDG